MEEFEAGKECHICQKYFTEETSESEITVILPENKRCGTQ